MIVYPMDNARELGEKVAKRAKARLGRLEMKKFPDGESYIRFDDLPVGEHAVLVQSMHPGPNDALISIAFAARTAKELGAIKVTAIIPYLGYMRQDYRFHPGECVSNRQMAWMLNQSIERLVTVDPHLHRVKSLQDLFHIERKKLSANGSIANYIKSRFSAKNSIIAGPDGESSQWAKAIADSIGFESVVFLKERFSSRHVKVNVTRELAWKGKDVIIVDDIISSGHTMIEAIKEVKKRAPRSVHVVCAHPIFAENAYAKILKAGAKSAWLFDEIILQENLLKISEAPDFSSTLSANSV